MSTIFEICKEQYTALRSEILQSIDKQHQIMLGGYALSATIFGYIVSKGDWHGLPVIPFTFLAMTSLWAVETNRMVRASYFIAFELLPKMINLVSSEQQGIPNWESWVRSDVNHAKDFCKRQHYLQMLVAFWIPLLVSIIVMIVVHFTPVKSIRASKSVSSLMLYGSLDVVLGFLWLYVGWFIVGISNLAAIQPSKYSTAPTQDTSSHLGQGSNATPPNEEEQNAV